MQLSYISISNYRSITSAYKIDLSNTTVLLGKNNEGKTNIIKAINLGMEIIANLNEYPRRRITRQYDWHEDFPLSLQKSKKIKNKKTTIRFDFILSPTESLEISGQIGSNINNVISIFISFNEDNFFSITVPKKGRNAKSISAKINIIAQYINQHFTVQYIPAVRSETDAYSAIADLVDMELSSINDEEYQKALEYINAKQQACLDSLAVRVTAPLKEFLPQIKTINLYVSDKYRKPSSLFMARRGINFEVDDGVLTSLTHKGDGVKSLATIALLSQISSTKNRLIIVDEPENHLHPEAIRYIDGVIHNLSNNNQVLISTHSPIFVNRNAINSNIIIENGEAKKADRIDTIRKTLGVICSDNLIYSDYVIVVEGPTDRDLIRKVIESDAKLYKLLQNNIITIRNVGGTNNLKSEIYALQRYCCNYVVIVDYDSAGKQEVQEIKNTLSVPEEKIRYFMKQDKKDTELEDFYNPTIYQDYLNRKGINITNAKFKNRAKKWSEKIEQIAAEAGIDFSKEFENQCKKGILEIIEDFSESCFTDEGYKVLTSIKEKIKLDLKAMSIIKE